ncbi:MAG: hypothetical protein WAV25_01285 [Minisyncoccia bacterium]
MIIESSKNSYASRFLIILTISAILFVVLFSFYKFYIKKDFTLYIKETCNPATEVCFVQECADDDVRCSSLPDKMFYFKIIYQKEYKLAKCTKDNCPSITCVEGDNTCSVYYCSEENLTKFGLSDTCSI